MSLQIPILIETLLANFFSHLVFTMKTAHSKANFFLNLYLQAYQPFFSLAVFLILRVSFLLNFKMY